MQSRLHTSAGFVGLDGSGLMFVKAIVAFFGGAVQVPRPMPSASRALSVHVRENWAVRIAACADETHFLVAQSDGRARCCEFPMWLVD